MQRLYWIAILAIVMGTNWLSADTIRLRDGSTVQGTFVGGDSRQVRLLGNDGNVQSFNINDIEGIRFTGKTTAAAPPPPPVAAPDPPPAPRRTMDVERSERAASDVVPAGTVITVRMIDPIDSDVNRAGERFRASLDTPLQIGERIIADRGSDVTVQIVRVQQSGKLTGRDELAVDLYEVTVNGRKYQAASSSAEVSSGSRGARTAKVAGGTAALGAIIGAIAGGGKGAAIGAGAGAATGVGIEEVTHGQRVKIASETRLDFTLKAPLAIY
jgi:hypothetical protein